MMTRMPLMLCGVLLLCVLTPTWAADRVTVLSDLAYVPQGDVRQRLDLYLPESAQPAPVLLVVHGGGFIFGDEDQMRDTAQYFAEAGYAVVAPTYRLAPAHPYPAPLNDVFCALAWTIAYAEPYRLDRTRIAVIGESAGANAVAMLAAVDDPAPHLTDCPYTIPADFELRGAVLYYPPADLSTCACPMAKNMAALYLGVESFDAVSENQLRQTWAEASPIMWLNGTEPPMLLIHGTDDFLIPTSESQLIYRRLQEVGVPAELMLIEGASHGFFGRMRLPETQASLRRVDAFLRRVTTTTN